MKILTPQEMAAADQAVFSRVKVPSLAVMESAGRAVAALAAARYGGALSDGVLVLAGGGNNGGDGYVAARALMGLGVSVRLASIKPLDELEGDCLANANAYLAVGGRISFLAAEGNAPSAIAAAAAENGLIIDALYGTGLQGAVRSPAKELIAAVSEAAASRGVPILSIDIPSGVEAGSGAVQGEAIEADCCAVLQSLKLGNVLAPGTNHCGDIVCLDIGVFAGLPEIADVRRELLLEHSVAVILKSRFAEQSEDHKGSRGHVLVLGGSAGHYGAPKMSANAALACGAGLVTLGLPRAAAEQIGPELRELMCAPLNEDPNGAFGEPDSAALETLLDRKAAVVIGPGMGQAKGASGLLKAVLAHSQQHDVPLVLDADAINLLADSKPMRQLLGEKVVLTPHPGEMSRLIGRPASEIQENRLQVAEAFVRAHRCCLVLKGARTVIAAPASSDGSRSEVLLWVNPAAVATLATGGSGDVLAGILGAFLARGLTPSEAARAAVFAHGCAGELAYWEKGGTTGTLAGELAAYVPRIVNALMRMPTPEPAFYQEVLPGGLHLLRGELLRF